MKKFFVLLLLLGASFGAFAQKKAFQFEAGLNYPFRFVEYGGSSSRIGVYLNGVYNFRNSPLSAKLRLSFDNYSHITKYELFTLVLSGRSVVVLPSLNYNFPTTSFAEFYAGAGIGVTFDNIGKGVFNEGHTVHPVFAPQVGVNLWKHLNFSAQYIFTHKKTSRLMVGVGYIF